MVILHTYFHVLLKHSIHALQNLLVSVRKMRESEKQWNWICKYCFFEFSIFKFICKVNCFVPIHILCKSDDCLSICCGVGRVLLKKLIEVPWEAPFSHSVFLRLCGEGFEEELLWTTDWQAFKRWGWWWGGCFFV